jgi:hypothetical protein
MPRLALPLLLLAAPACRDEGCLRDNDPECVVPTPCEGLAFPTCEAPAPIVRVIGAGGDPLAPTGPNALAAEGDVLLSNGLITAVIDAIDHPHYVAPTGGNLVDLTGSPDRVDSLRQAMTVIGLLPEDSPAWERIRTFEEPDGTVAVQVHGHLDNRPDVAIVTRYELHPCEPGLRVRTEVINSSEVVLSTLLSDGWYWGDREILPFTPVAGTGFRHPSFGLSTLNDVLTESPYMVGATHPGASTGYATIACNREATTGLNSEIISVTGLERRVLVPREYAVYERFIAAAPAGVSVAPAADLALEVRRQLFDEAWTELSGRVALPAGDPGDPADPIRASVIISEGTADTPFEVRVPWTHVVPAADGTFTVRVPADRSYVLEVEAFGVIVAEAEVDVGAAASPQPVEIEVPAAAGLRIDATIDGAPDPVLVFVRPATEAGETDLLGEFLGGYIACAPMIGHPYGDSPACDRVLVEGTTDVVVPPGDYEVFAVAGPFSTLARQTVTAVGGQRATVSLALTTLPLQPEGTLSADFHVHSAPSFDSSFGMTDRVRSFLAARVEVIASTEHDTVGDLAGVARDLGYDDRMTVINGTETTGHVLYDLFPESSFPRVIGHFNFWPVPYDPDSAWRGAPWDEEQQPGQLMTSMQARGWSPTEGVVQLNHPYGGFSFGRDFGWADAIDLNLNEELPTAYDGTGPSLFLHTPEGSAFANSDFHTEEVMNGSNNDIYQAYRALWFYLLDRGIPRGGTANSDSHSLADNVLGFPRNLVWASTTAGPDFDGATFHRAVREGRMIGTNGPVIELTTVDDAGATVGPSLTPFTPGPGASLRLVLRAAPWVPITEVRVWVNGAIVATLTDLPQPADELGTEGLLRLDTELPLADLLPAGGDAWLVVEAGTPLVAQADLDCNGFPDTGDNNGDGAIDWQDVADLDEEPDEPCYEAVGPMAPPTLPARGEPGYAFRVVVPGGWPLSFTNPLLFDRDGNGYEGVSR